MSPVRVDLAVVQRLAGEECGWNPVHGALTEIAAGFANHNWRVPAQSGDVLLKIGPVTSAGKWAAAQVGAEHARTVGLAVPELQTVRVVGEHLVRTLSWIVGESALTLVGDRRRQERLGVDLGVAVAALHADGSDTYTSRLDGSSATFPTWAEFVHDRVEAIEQRAVAADAPEPMLRRQAASAIEHLASTVSSHCGPVVCHRDLHAENLIVGADGSLAAIVDWDMAEAWDAAGEWFKLELFLFEQLPHTQAAFESAYAENAAVVPADRRRAVVLLESLNVVANANVFDSDFVAFGIRQLRQLI